MLKRPTYFNIETEPLLNETKFNPMRWYQYSDSSFMNSKAEGDIKLPKTPYGESEYLNDRDEQKRSEGFGVKSGISEKSR